MRIPKIDPIGRFRAWTRWATGWMEPGTSEGDVVAALAIALIAVLCIGIVLGELL